jgi:iron complex outermembrane recepter protein
LQNQNATFTLAQDISTRYQIDTLGSEWSVDASYQHIGTNGTQAYQTRAQLPTPTALLGDGDITTRRHFGQLQTDLRLKRIRKLTIEAGLKTTLQQFDSRTAFTQVLNGSPRQPDPFRTNTFDYSEAIHASPTYSTPTATPLRSIRATSWPPATAAPTPAAWASASATISASKSATNA